MSMPLSENKKMRFVWLSDLHFLANGEVLDRDPRQALDNAITLINTHMSDAAFCVISGDIADHASTENYAAAATKLGGLNIPVYPMIGNHDDRTLFREHFAIPDTSAAPFVQYEAESEAAVILALDTVDPGKSSGALCADRLGWLEDRLAANVGKRVLVFMHHPPMRLYLPAQDQDQANFQNADAFFALLKRHGNVAHIGCGHVHRAASGTIHGIPYTALSSIMFQTAPPNPPWDWDDFQPSEDKPTIATVTLDDDGINIQIRNIL